MGGRPVLLRQGLAPSDCFLDIACGSLRGGVYFINYVNPGNYLGIEKQRRLVERGIEKGILHATARSPILTFASITLWRKWMPSAGAWAGSRLTSVIGTIPGTR
jgi:hypothetical protein